MLALVLAFLPLFVNSLHVKTAKPESECPSMFVAIFSRESEAKRRSLLRTMWVNDDSFFDRDDDVSIDPFAKTTVAPGWSNLVANFVICTAGGELPKSLEAESEKFNDLLFVDCREGYGEGMLTQKTLATMKAFQRDHSDMELFMKVDDDTFVARSRLCDFILQNRGPEGFQHSYMGVITPREGEAKPHRDKESQFYEPPDVYPNETYPKSMEGGPGYILGNSLINELLTKNIPEGHMLWVEDKAVGVWVHELEGSGTRVNWVGIPGTDGYSIWKDHGTWKDYPYILRHHLLGSTISCMTNIANRNKIDEPVDKCWSKI